MPGGDLTPDDATARILSCAQALRAQGLEAVVLFGSVAKGVATPASDVDMLLEPQNGYRLTLRNYLAARDILADVFLRSIDAVIAGSENDTLAREIASVGVRVAL